MSHTDTLAPAAARAPQPAAMQVSDEVAIDGKRVYPAQNGGCRRLSWFSKALSDFNSQGSSL